ncbi:MAG: hypothetical protein IPJ52_07140 [Rhodocyclaceae bacterium]|nr:hypothetical protein [Rhodocyclaceae bacterium]
MLPNSNRIGSSILELARNHRTARGWIGGSYQPGPVPALAQINTARDSVSAFIYFNF